MSRAGHVNNIPNSKNAIKQFIAKNRSWQFTECGKKLMKKQLQGFDFTVMTYNILAQELLQNHMHLYNKCNPQHLNWNFRSQNLLKEIAFHNADVICLQEVQENHFLDTILPYLSNHGYLGLYKKKTRDGRDGSAILFKKSVFHLESYKTVEFYNHNIRILDRNQIGLIVVLNPRDFSMFKGAKIIIATTHLLFNPKRGDVKFTQLRMLLAEIEIMARRLVFDYEMVYHPVILCGDLNCQPFSPLYQFITRGNFTFNRMLSGDVSGQSDGCNKGKLMVDSALSLSSLGINNSTQYVISQNVPKSPSKNAQNEASSSKNEKKQKSLFSHPLHLISTYRHVTPNDQEITNFVADTLGTTDYIFYSMGYVPKNSRRKGRLPENGELKHLANYSLFYWSQINNLPPLPNAFLSSDHTCLISHFLFNPKHTF